MSQAEAPRTALEERIVTAVGDGRDELVALVSDLVSFDTTARNVGDPPRQEAELQQYLRRRLDALHGETDVWEPEPTGTGNRVVPDGLDFVGRPQLAARLRGAGNGRSLLLNGHIDAVSAEPVADWASHPHRPEVRDGKLYGRGSCDMKGGIGAMLFALETLRRLGIELAGDILFCTDTDEESSGAGAYACAARGVRADAGLCAEPTGFDVWVACRGGVNPKVRALGRTGHAEMHHPHWREGGPVNAIEKMSVVLDAIRALREQWRTRPEHQHPYLHVPDILPTVIAGGEWMVTYPSSCEATLSVQYMPGSVDASGTGQAVFEEVEAFINAAAAKDDWLAEHPLEWEWPCDIVPAEVPDDHPIVGAALRAAADVGRRGRISGLDSWHDAAVFTRMAATPTVSFGPGEILRAHTVDEYVPVDDLVDHAAAVALVLMRWCGVAGERRG
jgi:acetylornithine deacetylase